MNGASHYTWDGRIDDWPRWMTFLNYATDGQTIHIHTLLQGIIQVNLGETIVRAADGEFTILKENSHESSAHMDR